MGDQQPRAGIYTRLSYAPDGSVEGVERQEADCRALSQRLGWSVSEAHVWQDNSRSAWKRNRRRPGWDAMLAAIEAGEIDSIIVYHGDRLIRQPFDLEKLINISESRGVRIASVSGTRSLDSPDDRFILRIEAAQACRESDNTSRRTTRALAARAERGLTQVGGRRPFGYGVQTGTRTKTDRTGEEVEAPVYDTTQQVPEEAAYLATVVDRLLAGQSLAGAVRWLRSEGVTTTTGGEWTTRGLTLILASPRIAGLIRYDGRLLPAAWDGIISADTWEAVNALLARNAELYPHPGRERRYLLSGVAECGPCGGGRILTKPSGGRNRKTSRVYYCAACRKVGRNQEHLDRYVEGRVLRLLNSPAFLAELQAAPAGGDGLMAEVAELERRKSAAVDQLERLADLPGIDPGLVARSIASFDRKLGELRAQILAQDSRRGLTRLVGISLADWTDEPIDVRSGAVRHLFRVVIQPTSLRGPGFDPASVSVSRRSLRQGRDDGGGGAADA